MNNELFSEVKARVRMPELVRYYGIEVNRADMCCCPFHDEKTASAKLYEDSFHCFGCGEHQDAVGFVAKYFDLTQIEAIKKINADLHLGLEVDKPIGKAQAAEYIKQRKKEAAERRAYEQWELGASSTLAELNRTLLMWQDSYAPKFPEEMNDPDERYLYAISNSSMVENVAIDFIGASKEEKLDMKPLIEDMEHKLGEVKEIEKKLNEQQEINELVPEDTVLIDNSYPEENKGDDIADSPEKVKSSEENDRKEDKKMPVLEEKKLPSEEDILKYAKKIEQNYSEEKEFSETFSQYLNNSVSATDIINVGRTPYALQIAGAKELPLSITQTTLKNSMNPESVILKHHTSGHDISADILFHLPQMLREPIMILEDKGTKNLVAITEYKDNEDRNIICRITLNKAENQHIVNRISSMYGKRELADYITRAFNDNRVKAIHKEKADLLFRSIGCQSPKEETFISFDNSIAYTTANVKYPQEEFIEKTQFYEAAEHDKLLPMLNAKAAFHEGRLDMLLGKRNTQEQKILKNEAKIEMLIDKANRLEDLSRALSTISNIPAVQTMIDQTERRIEEIRQKKIPVREMKINEHKQRITEIDKCSAVIGHKLERAVALSDTIRSFAVIGKERNAQFAEAMDRLDRSTLDCLLDKENAISIRLTAKTTEFSDERTSTADKLELQQDITKLQAQISEIGDKIAKIKTKSTYIEQSDNQLKTAMQTTAEKISSIVKSGEINLPQLAEKISIPQDGETLSHENYLKNAEMAVEGNYNNIDGIINNIAPEQPASEDKSLFSIEQNGERREYLNKDENSIFDMLQVCSEAEQPYAALMQKGVQIDSVEFAEIQQSKDFTFSVDINFDDNTVQIYSVGDHLSEMDRTDENTFIKTLDLDTITSIVTDICNETSDPTTREQLLTERLLALNVEKDNTMFLNEPGSQEIPGTYDDIERIADRVIELQNQARKELDTKYTDFAISRFTREEIINAFNSEDTQSLEFAINDLKGVVPNDTERLNVLDSIRELQNDKVQRIELTKEEVAILFGKPGEVEKAMETYSANKSEDSPDWLTEMFNAGKAEIDKDGGFKLNPQYYKELDKNDRQTVVCMRSESQQLLKGLADNGIKFSAVTRKNDKVAITISKNDIPVFNNIASENNMQTINASERSTEERTSFTVGRLTAPHIEQALHKQNIAYSASETRSGIKITVSKTDSEAAHDICKKEMYINPEFYASLNSEDRHTQRMDEQSARRTVNELKKAGIEHSAVFKGDRSGVTINKNDYKKASDSRISLGFLKKKTNEKKQEPKQQNQSIGKKKDKEL